MCALFLREPIACVATKCIMGRDYLASGHSRTYTSLCLSDRTRVDVCVIPLGLSIITPLLHGDN